MELITDKKTYNGTFDKKFIEFLKTPVPVKPLTQERADELYKILSSALTKYSGIGISANQIGIKERVCLIRFMGKEYYFVNPVITEKSEDRFLFAEACLSIPKTLKNPIRTIRFVKIKVSTDNLGELEFQFNKEDDKKTEISEESLLCGIVQHEIDHLDGLTIKDRQYITTYVNTSKFNRNEKVVMKSPTGELVEVKFKKANDYFLKGYEVV